MNKLNKPITVWYVNDSKSFCYCLNHIEDGHVQDWQPKPKSQRQQVWNDWRWMRQHLWLDESNQVVYKPWQFVTVSYLWIWHLSWCNWEWIPAWVTSLLVVDRCRFESCREINSQVAELVTQWWARMTTLEKRHERTNVSNIYRFESCPDYSLQLSMMNGL